MQKAAAAQSSGCPYDRYADPVLHLPLIGCFALQVRIETVDSFQGKQLDVIIFSCVRAAGADGASPLHGKLHDRTCLSALR